MHVDFEAPVRLSGLQTLFFQVLTIVKQVFMIMMIR